MVLIQQRNGSGFSLVEVVLASAIIAVIVPMIYVPIQTFLRGVKSEVLKTRSLDMLQPVDIILDRDLLEMVELRVARPDRIEFILDSNHLPNYNPSTTNLRSPDDDGDALDWVSPSDWWRRGNDLDDDDDDGDGKLDVWMAYSFIGDTLVREVSYNEGPIETFVVSKSIYGGLFSYFGSTKRKGGAPMDLNSDGIVTGLEIDGTLPPVGVGDGTGVLDTPDELRAVVYINLFVNFDPNGDGKADRKLDKNIMPPLLNFRSPRL
jgi:prepilin-type N-terminal cleavage/methylation domain-containing protein